MQVAPFEKRLDEYFKQQEAKRRAPSFQLVRLVSSIEGISDEELHAALVQNAVRKYEEASKQFEQLFQEPEDDILDELFPSS